MALKLRVLTKFPARVVAETGLAVELEDGEYTFSLDMGSLATIDSVPDDEAAFVPVVTPGATDDDPDVNNIVSIADLLALILFNNDALSELGDGSSTGFWTITGAGTGEARTFQAATGLTWTNPAGQAGDPSVALNLNALSADASPDPLADYVVTYDASAGAHKKVLVGNVAGSAGSVTALNGQTGALTVWSPPQGRLSLATGVPNMATSYSAQTTVYYTPAVGNICPIYDGTRFVPTVFAELSQATTDNTKSPAAVTTNSNYDVFVWNDGGTIRATRGPAWSSSTSRGTGAGTTELTLVNGIYINANAITNGPAANRGTYVGTIRSNGSSQIDYILGGLGAGGVQAILGVWNMYNRAPVAVMVQDSTNSWTYTTATTWRASNNSSTMRINAVRGLDVDGIDVSFTAIALTTNPTIAAAGVGIDSTTAFSGTTSNRASTATSTDLTARYCGLMGLGYHYVSALEYVDNVAGSLFAGDTGTPSAYQNGLMGVFYQ